MRTLLDDIPDPHPSDSNTNLFPDVIASSEF